MSIGTAALPGVITAGGGSPASPQDLFFYYYGMEQLAPLTVNAALADNAGQHVRLITWVANIGFEGVNGAASSRSKASPAADCSAEACLPLFHDY